MIPIKNKIMNNRHFINSKEGGEALAVCAVCLKAMTGNTWAHDRCWRSLSDKSKIFLQKRSEICMNQGIPFYIDDQERFMLKDNLPIPTRPVIDERGETEEEER